MALHSTLLVIAIALALKPALAYALTPHQAPEEPRLLAGLDMYKRSSRGRASRSRDSPHHPGSRFCRPSRAVTTSRALATALDARFPPSRVRRRVALHPYVPPCTPSRNGVGHAFHTCARQFCACLLPFRAAVPVPPSPTPLPPLPGPTPLLRCRFTPARPSNGASRRPRTLLCRPPFALSPPHTPQQRCIRRVSSRDAACSRTGALRCHRSSSCRAARPHAVPLTLRHPVRTLAAPRALTAQQACLGTPHGLATQRRFEPPLPVLRRVLSTPSRRPLSAILPPARLVVASWALATAHALATAQAVHPLALSRLPIRHMAAHAPRRHAAGPSNAPAMLARVAVMRPNSIVSWPAVTRRPREPTTRARAAVLWPVALRCPPAPSVAALALPSGVVFAPRRVVFVPCCPALSLGSAVLCCPAVNILAPPPCATTTHPRAPPSRAVTPLRAAVVRLRDDTLLPRPIITRSLAPSLPVVTRSVTPSSPAVARHRRAPSRQDTTRPRDAVSRSRNDASRLRALATARTAHPLPAPPAVSLPFPIPSSADGRRNGRREGGT
ncbi:hypothetical protein DENSPDRAFT_886637 [Dentipellis sp. KUC8613]|nr:hypothetical protein DENSPDRAFT_886637 [Dentipellis sp. KUC8613]